MRGMKDVTVGFDVDDVIFPWYDVAHRICVEKGLAPPHVSPRTWRPHEEYGVDKQAWVDLMSEACKDGSLYSEPPLDDVLEPMNRLACNIPGWDIRIMLVTARGFWAHGEIVRQHTYDQLHRFKVPYSWIVFTQDKTAVRPMEFFIDDNLKNYDMLTAAGTDAFLLNRPWNQESDARQRVDTVREYVDTVISRLRPPKGK